MSHLVLYCFSVNCHWLLALLLVVHTFTTPFTHHCYVRILALVRVWHSDPGIHKVGVANSSERYLPPGLHFDGPTTSLRVDRPLASVSAFITS